MKTKLVTVEESHYPGKATDYPYNVWLDGRWFHLETGDEAVELGDEVMVKYHPQDQFATVDRKAKLPPTEADKQAEKIYNVLNGQRFADWYNKGEFDAHITGDLPAVPKEKIIDYIKKHFLV